MSNLREFALVTAVSLVAASVAGLAVLGFGYAFFIDGGIF